MGDLGQSARAPVSEAEKPRGLLLHRLADADDAPCRQHLQTLGQVDGEARRDSVWTRVGAEGSHDDRAGMHAHPEVQRYGPGAPRFISIGRQGLLYPQRRMQGADDMILLGDGRPEERDEAIPGALGNAALKALDLVSHQGGSPREQLVEHLCIDCLGQRSHAFQASHQDGDLLALSWHSVMGAWEVGSHRRGRGGMRHSL